jgi:hypothetical protein
MSQTIDQPTIPRLEAADLVVGCVTEDNPKYLGQALRLLQSIRWFGGGLAGARVVVGAVDRIDSRARRALESLDAEVRIVPRFEPRNGSANRLQLLSALLADGEQNLLMLDCDTIVVRDPLLLLRPDVFQAKIAPLPTITHEVFERLFAHFDMTLPERTAVTDHTGTPTIPYFNAGVFEISAAVAKRLVPEWRRFNGILAGQPALVAPCEKHLHQAALALALAATGVPVIEMGSELNFQLNMTQYPAPAGYRDIDPYIIHYHELAGEDGLLLPCPFPRAQERIDRFHDRLREERARKTGLGVKRRAPATSPMRLAVVGMHRSGTSLLARLLHAMGCYAGEEQDFQPPDVFNPGGYFEHKDVVALDEEMLAALGASWLDPERGDTERLTADDRNGFEHRARKIAKRFDSNGTWMMKDPRLAILFPVWRAALEEPLCVLIWREPMAVARSLSQRDGFPLALGLALWEEYARAMLANTIGLPRVLVSYEELVSDPTGSAGRLHRSLVAAGAADLHLPGDDQLREIIDPTLDRQTRGGEDLLNQQQKSLRDGLKSGAALDWAGVPVTDPETRELLAEHLRQNEAIAAQRKQSDELQALLEAVFGSRSWRIGFGLTRLWRKLLPTGKETALERWEKR